MTDTRLTPSATTLEGMALHQTMLVSGLGAPDMPAEWSRWLEEIGFIPGEPVTLLARAIPGGDPLVVRIGNSTFALRRAEAACVRVETAP